MNIIEGGDRDLQEPAGLVRVEVTGISVTVRHAQKLETDWPVTEARGDGANDAAVLIGFGELSNERFHHAHLCSARRRATEFVRGRH